jgi:hypothetical protein
MPNLTAELPVVKAFSADCDEEAFPYNDVDRLWFNSLDDFPAFLSGYINHEQIEAKLEQIGLEN